MQNSKVLADYQSRVIDRTEFIDLAGIPLPRDKEGRVKHLRLHIEKVYIPILIVKEEMRRSSEKEEIAQLERNPKSTISSCGINRALYNLGQHLYNQNENEPTLEKASRTDPQEALNEHHRMVIQGAPGSGKSTLLRWMARYAVKNPTSPIPVLISLRDYASFCDGGGKESLCNFGLREAAENDPLLVGVLKKAEKKDGILWLIDGLDEARIWRDKAVREIKQLSGDLIITSRPFGYQKAGLETMHHFEIAPLAVQDIDRFIENWFRVLSEQEETSLKLVGEIIQWLKEQLDSRPSIRILTQNPLLLTFLTVLAGEDPRRDLPVSRFELYRRYIEELFNSWESTRLQKGKSSSSQVFELGDLREENARRAALEGLYNIGWLLHLSYYGGKADDSAVSSESLVKKLCQARWLEEDWGLSHGSAEVVARGIIGFWKETGMLDTWFIEGKEYLAFRHLTFQEYAASWALEKAWNKDPDATWRFLRIRMHHYAWKEPILLLSEILDTNLLSNLLSELLRGPSKYERELHRDLFLAGSILAESVSIKPDQRNQIIERVAQLAKGHKVGDLELKSFPRLQSLLFIIFRARNYVPDPAQAFFILGNAGSNAIPYLTPYLVDSDFYLRSSAIEAFGNIGDGSTVPLLIPLLKDPISVVRWNTITALIKICDASTIPLLIPLLKDSDNDVRERVAHILGNIDDGSAVTHLIPLLKDSDNDVRERVAHILGNIDDGSAIEHLVPILKDSDSRIRWRAVEAIGNIGGATAIEHLVPLLKDSDSSVRWRAVEAVGNIGGATAIEHLVPLLKDSDSDVRVRVVKILRNIDDVSIVPILISLLKDSNSDIRVMAIGTLRNIGNASTIPHLIPLLKDSSYDVRSCAAIALGNAGDISAIPQLISLLKDSSSYIRARAVEALGYIGNALTIPYLIPLLKDSSYDVRSCATEAIEDIGDASIIPPLIPLLKDSDNDVRVRVVEILRNIYDVSTVPILISLLKDSNSDLRARALEAIRNINSISAIPYLAPLLRDSNSYVRSSAILAFKNIGHASAIPLLTPLLKDSSSSVQFDAAVALRNFGDISAIPYLAPLLKESNSYARSSAVLAFKNIGHASAIPLLLPMLTDSNSDVRFGAAEALEESIRNADDYKVINKVAHELWWRLTDTKYVAKAALQALNQAATRLVELEVRDLEMIDPLYLRKEQTGTKQLVTKKILENQYQFLQI